MVTRLLLVRHGQTAWNVEARFQGQTDIPLNVQGRGQILALAKRLASEKLDAIYASDLARTWQTATAIAAHHAISLRADSRLREMHLGDWEGLTYSEIQARDPERLARWLEDPARVSPPGGETLTALVARVQSVLDDLHRCDNQHNVLLVSHGGTLRVLLCLALGMPPQNRWRLRLDEASISELYLYDEGAILTRLNDRHHLEDTPS